MSIGREYLIRGKVQGVGFRFFVSRCAVNIGVRGSVRNLPDGRVKVIAEGELSLISDFEKIIFKGPPEARVEDVKVFEIQTITNRKSFSILD